MASRKLRFLITAGPTREYIDPVRYISNDSSGRMGFALAAAAARRGYGVTLVHGPVALKPPADMRAVAVVSAAEMLAACEEHWPRCDVLIMAAAVADYTPVRAARHKLKKAADPRVLRLKPTVDILARLSRRRRPGQTVIGFALEDRNARRNAEKKLREKRLDAIVLNSPRAIGARHSSMEILVADGGWEPFRDATKPRQARRLIEIAERVCGRRSGPQLAADG